MQVRAKDYCAGRTSDGRMFVVMQGAVTAFDDDDEPMIALAKAWIAAGTAEEVDAAPELESTEDTQPPVEQPPAESKPAVKKAAATRRASTKESGE